MRFKNSMEKNYKMSAKYEWSTENMTQIRKAHWHGNGLEDIILSRYQFFTN